jgi:hypothetical protein
MKKNIWTIIRTTIFIFIGLKSTIFIRPENVGGWENYLGYLLLIFAAFDLSSFLIKFYRKKLKQDIQ